MATNTAGSTARNLHQQSVHYLRKTITNADDDATVTVGIIPSGSLVLKPSSGIHVTTAFAGGTPILDIGPDSNPDLLGTDLALGTTTFVPLDEEVGGYLVTSDTTIVAQLTSGSAITAGSGEIIITFIPDNDG